MNRFAEEMIVQHGAPTLAKLKPANLFSCEGNCYQCEDVSRCSRQLNRAGVCLRTMHFNGKRSLMLVYRAELLWAHLEQPEVQEFLRPLGYSGTLEQHLHHLQKRIHFCGGFPHEIGLFLGYPLEDVVGFMRNQGRNYKLCGYWKVYGDAERARALFRSFTGCRETLLRHYRNGTKLSRLCLG